MILSRPLVEDIFYLIADTYFKITRRPKPQRESFVTSKDLAGEKTIHDFPISSDMLFSDYYSIRRMGKNLRYMGMQPWTAEDIAREFKESVLDPVFKKLGQIEIEKMFGKF